MDRVGLGEIVSVDDLADAIGFLQRRHAEVAVATARLAAAGGWAGDGFVSMTAWLAHHCRMSHADAAGLLREGRFLARYEAVAVAATTGRLSASQVAAVRAAVTVPTAELFDEHQHTVVDAVAELGVTDTVRVCQQWRQRGEAVVDIPEPNVPRRSWKSSTLDDGTLVGRFVFDPAAAAQIAQAIATAHIWDGPGDDRAASGRNADAVFDIIAFFNANHHGEGTPRHRPHVELHLDAHSFVHPDGDGTDCTHNSGTDPAKPFEFLNDSAACAVTGNGQLLTGWATNALTCDCVIHRVLRAGSVVLDYGRTTRSVPKHLFRAVACRDGGCRFPHCTRNVAWCDAHHIRWWRNNGETKLDNLILLCARHHHLIHQQHWQIQLKPHGQAEFTTPDRRTLTSQPRGDPHIRTPIAA